jgi:hypothetical protein
MENMIYDITFSATNIVLNSNYGVNKSVIRGFPQSEATLRPGAP